MAFSVKWTIELADKFTGAARKISDSLYKINSRVVRAKKSLKEFGLSASLYLTAPFILASKSILGAAAAMQQIGIQVKSVAGGSKVGSQEMQFLIDKTKKIPFTLQELSDGFAKLKGAGMNVKDANKALIQFANISATVNKPMRILEYGMLRMKMQGKATMQILRDFTGLPIQETLMAMAKEHGYHIKDVEELFKAGAVTYKVMMEVFRRITAKGGMAYKHAEKQAATLGGRWKILKNVLFLTEVPLGKVLDQTFGLQEHMRKLTYWILQIMPEIPKFAKAHPILIKILLYLTGILAAVGPLALALRGLIIIFGLLTGPIGIILELGAAITILYMKFKPFRDAVNDMDDTFTAIFSNLRMLIKWLIEDIKHLFKLITKSPIGFLESIPKKLGMIGKEYLVSYFAKPVGKADILARSALAPTVAPSKFIAGIQQMRAHVNVNIHDTAGAVKSAWGNTSGGGTMNLNVGSNMAMAEL
jgi:hypothetical protein